MASQEWKIKAQVFFLSCCVYYMFIFITNTKRAEERKFVPCNKESF